MNIYQNNVALTLLVWRLQEGHPAYKN